jgi:hypothetical protein
VHAEIYHATTFGYGAAKLAEGPDSLDRNRSRRRLKLANDMGGAGYLRKLGNVDGHPLPYLQAACINHLQARLCPFGIAGQVTGATRGHAGRDVDGVGQLEAV